MTFPLMKEPSSAPVVMHSPPDADNPSFYVLDERVRILFADDDPILREFAKVHLATESAGVVTAQDGEDAWDALQAEAFDLLLVDLEMPNLDGFDLVKRMRADPLFRGLPVIVVTGREDISAIDRAFDCGATSFVVKPINWRLLSYQVRFIMRSHRVESFAHTARAEAGAEEARLGSTVKLLFKESAELLALAMRGDPALRGAARRYATLLSGLSYAGEDRGNRAA